MNKYGAVKWQVALKINPKIDASVPIKIQDEKI